MNAATFGNASFFGADGQLHAQLLFVPGLYVNGRVRNVIFGATEASSMYAWDLGERGTHPEPLTLTYKPQRPCQQQPALEKGSETPHACRNSSCTQHSSRYAWDLVRTGTSPWEHPSYFSDTPQ